MITSSMHGHNHLALAAWATALGESVSIEDWVKRHVVGQHPMADGIQNKLAQSSLRGYCCAVGTPVLDMVVTAVAKLFKQGVVAEQDIDLVVYSHTLASSIVNPPGDLVSEISKRFGVEADGFSLDQYQCAGTSYVMQAMEAWVSAHPETRAVLYITADLSIDESSRYDASSQHFHADGAMASVFVPGGSGPVHRASANVVDPSYHDNLQRSFSPFAMAAYELTAVKAHERCMTAALEAAKIACNEISAVVPVSTDPRRWSRALRRLDIPENLIKMPNYESVSHLYASDVLFNLCSAVDQGLLKPGDCVLCPSMGEGRTFGCSVFSI